MAARPIEQLESDPRWHSNMRPALLRESQGEVVKVVEASIRALVDGDLNACMAAAGVVKEVAWERLHTGPWKDVLTVWRDLYTVSILLHRACVQAEGDIHQDIRDFDLAILMGGPLFRPEVDSAIQNRQLMYNMLLLRTPTPSAAATPNLNIRDLALSLSLTPSSTVSCAADAAATPVLLGTETPLSPPCHRSTTMAAGGAAASATAVPTVPAPQLDEMVERFMFAGSEKEGLPGVFTGAMQHWPALARWSDVAYLKKLAGPRLVPVELGKNYLADGWTQRLMPFDRFLDQHVVRVMTVAADGAAASVKQPPAEQLQPTDEHLVAVPAAKRPRVSEEHPLGKREQTQPASDAGNEAGGAAEADDDPTDNAVVGYLAQHSLLDQIPALAADICTPDYCALGEGKLQAVNAWLGPAGTVTPLHHDPHHNLLAQVVGRKYVRLYAPEHSARLYASQQHLTTNSSEVDVEHVDSLRFPLFAHTPCFECVLEPGQMLYIPPKWWHFVKSLTSSFSVSFWWQ